MNLRNFNPRKIHFFVSFLCKTIFPTRTHRTRLVSKDVEFYCASFDIYEKFAGACPPTQTPTQKLKSWFSMSSSQGIASSLISFEMIFRVLQSELFRFKFKSLSSKIVKIPEFNLSMYLFEWYSEKVYLGHTFLRALGVFFEYLDNLSIFTCSIQILYSFKLQV